MTSRYEPALPVPSFARANGQTEWGSSGLTAIEHAALTLRVPESGTPWLDAMIRQSLRQEIATNYFSTCSESKSVELANKLIATLYPEGK